MLKYLAGSTQISAIYFEIKIYIDGWTDKCLGDESMLLHILTVHPFLLLNSFSVFEYIIFYQFSY